MAWLAERQRTSYVSYQVTWKPEGSKKRSRCFTDRAEAEAFLAEMQKRWPGTRGSLPADSPEALRVRIERHVSRDDNGCWLWTAYVAKTGYGMITVHRNGKMLREGAHRVSYEAIRGPIPFGLQLDHLCRVRACVNPDHLEPVTPRENVMRSPVAQAALNAAKTHCPAGHPYSDENTYRYSVRGRGPGRACRACMKASRQRRLAANGGAR